MINTPEFYTAESWKISGHYYWSIRVTMAKWFFLLSGYVLRGDFEESAQNHFWSSSCFKTVVNDVYVEMHGIKHLLLNLTYYIIPDISEDGSWTLLTWNTVNCYEKKSTCAIVIIYQVMVWAFWHHQKSRQLKKKKISPKKFTYFFPQIFQPVCYSKLFPYISYQYSFIQISFVIHIKLLVSTDWFIFDFLQSTKIVLFYY